MATATVRTVLPVYFPMASTAYRTVGILTDAYPTSQVENTSYTATSVETYQLDVESTALVSLIHITPYTPSMSRK